VLAPNIRTTMRANRAFLGRVVRFLAGQAGIRQFLDVGSGIPTENAVHQVAQDTAPGSRVLYVDNATSPSPTAGSCWTATPTPPSSTATSGTGQDPRRPRNPAAP